MAAKQKENLLHMPEATAIWLIDNTALTFQQIADFTNLLKFDIEVLANKTGTRGRDPMKDKILTTEEIQRCEADPEASLQILKSDRPVAKSRSKGPKYTPVSKRADKPNAIAWLLKHKPELSDAQITKLVGTSKPTIEAIRTRSHPDSSNLKPQNPAELGLCTFTELENVYNKALKAAGKDPEEMKRKKQEEAEAEAAAQAAQDAEDAANDGSAFDFSNFLGK